MITYSTSDALPYTAFAMFVKFQNGALCHIHEYQYEVESMQS